MLISWRVSWRVLAGTYRLYLPDDFLRNIFVYANVMWKVRVICGCIKFRLIMKIHDVLSQRMRNLMGFVCMRCCINNIYIRYFHQNHMKARFFIIPIFLLIRPKTLTAKSWHALLPRGPNGVRWPVSSMTLKCRSSSRRSRRDRHKGPLFSLFLYSQWEVTKTW